MFLAKAVDFLLLRFPNEAVYGRVDPMRAGPRLGIGGRIVIVEILGHSALVILRILTRAKRPRSTASR